MLYNNILLTVLISSTISLIVYFAIISKVEQEKININTASVEELKRLPSISDKNALEIVKNRPYVSVYDLNKIEGIGTSAIQKIEKLVICEEVRK